MAALYTEMSGRPVEALEWFEVFAAQRFAIVSVRTSLRASPTGRWRCPTTSTTSSCSGTCRSGCSTAPTGADAGPHRGYRRVATACHPSHEGPERDTLPAREPSRGPPARGVRAEPHRPGEQRPRGGALPGRALGRDAVPSGHHHPRHPARLGPGAALAARPPHRPRGAAHLPRDPRPRQRAGTSVARPTPPTAGPASSSSRPRAGAPTRRTATRPTPSSPRRSPTGRPPTSTSCACCSTASRRRSPPPGRGAPGPAPADASPRTPGPGRGRGRGASFGGHDRRHCRPLAALPPRLSPPTS